MATVREGRRSVLLLVDLQVGVARDAWQAEQVTTQVALAVEQARAAGLPVIWVQHQNEQLVPGSVDWQWVSALQPAAGETRIDKRYNSAFEQTPLEEELTRLGATHLILAGAASNWCIRATAYAALERGYDLTLLADAHTTPALELEDGHTVPAESIVRDLNATMHWLRYPGRRNAALTVQACDFAGADRPGALPPA